MLSNLEGASDQVVKLNLWILLRALVNDGRGEFLKHLGLVERDNLVLLNSFSFRKIDSIELITRIKDMRRVGQKLGPGVYTVALDQFLAVRDVGGLQFAPLHFDLASNNAINFQALEDPNACLYLFKAGKAQRVALHSPKPTQRLKSNSRPKVATQLKDKANPRRTVKLYESERAATNPDVGLLKRPESREPTKTNLKDYLSKKISTIAKNIVKDPLATRSDAKVPSQRETRALSKTQRISSTIYKPKTATKSHLVSQTFSHKKTLPSIDLKLVRTDKRALEALNSVLKDDAKEPIFTRFDVNLGLKTSMGSAKKRNGSSYGSEPKFKSMSLKQNPRLKSRMM